MQQRETGFTLVELMVTVAVIALILMIGVPGIVNMKRNSDLITTARELTVALNYARAEAVRQGVDIDVVAKVGGWGTGWEIQLSSDGSVIRSFEAPPTGIALALTGGPVTFEGLGNVAATACFDVTVSDSSSVRSLPISAAGRVTTCRASCTVITGDPTKCD
ncbi:MAG: GspH/FimT family pseudopilin [Gammaproteobacteria bacterium]|nr:GspH/FimT family pseudopilin [Gammaproteobacteria bacterium]